MIIISCRVKDQRGYISIIISMLHAFDILIFIVDAISFTRFHNERDFVISSEDFQINNNNVPVTYSNFPHYEY